MNRSASEVTTVWRYRNSIIIIIIIIISVMSRILLIFINNFYSRKTFGLVFFVSAIYSQCPELYPALPCPTSARLICCYHYATGEVSQPVHHGVSLVL